MDQQEVVNENANFDEILAAMSVIEDELGMNASDVDPQVLKTWNKAQNSPDAERW